VQAEVYLHLWLINRAFERVLKSLDVLRGHPGFRRGEMDRFRNLSQEARAAMNSYLVNVVETAETDKAGRHFRKRIRRERREERG
jgi:mono/diheme cytochrome c family protein